MDRVKAYKRATQLQKTRRDYKFGFTTQEGPVRCTQAEPSKAFECTTKTETIGEIEALMIELKEYRTLAPKLARQVEILLDAMEGIIEKSVNGKARHIYSDAMNAIKQVEAIDNE